MCIRHKKLHFYKKERVGLELDKFLSNKNTTLKEYFENTEGWFNAEDETPDDSYVCLTYTNGGYFRYLYYLNGVWKPDQMNQLCDEHVRFWKKAEYIPNDGVVVDNICYSGFPEYRYNSEQQTIRVYDDDEITIVVDKFDGDEPFAKYFFNGSVLKNINNNFLRYVKIYEIHLRFVGNSDFEYDSYFRNVVKVKQLEEEKIAIEKDAEEQQKRYDEERKNYQKQLEELETKRLKDKFDELFGNINLDDILPDIEYRISLLEERKKFEKKRYLAETVCRQCGQTTRIINDCIDELFEKPVGTRILLKDHYPSREIISNFRRRMNCQFPNVEYTVENGRDCSFYIVRKTKTIHEQYIEEQNKMESDIDDLKKMINIVKNMS